jgi:uncharacterized membrane protein
MLITVAGTLCGLFLLSYLARLPAISEVSGQHIVYIFPHFHVMASTGLYLLSTCIGPLFSSHRMVRLCGLAATLSFMATYVFYATWFISVWCFFARKIEQATPLDRKVTSLMFTSADEFNVGAMANRSQCAMALNCHTSYFGLPLNGFVQTQKVPS